MRAIPFSRILPAALGLVVGGLGLRILVWMLTVNLKTARQSACGCRARGGHASADVSDSLGRPEKLRAYLGNSG